MRFIIIVTFLILQFIITNNAYAFNVNNAQIDSLRAELACIRDKSSPNYIKTKQKLEKLIIQNKINYNTQSRLEDVQRLIYEQKFNSAIYELNDLIENNTELSTCYELLADISYKCSKNIKKTAQHYKTSLYYDEDNTSASFKLAKLYLKENKNILGIEFLKQTVEKTNNEALLLQIEDMVKNKITPQDKYEANNLYETLGEIYLKLGRKQESYSAFNKALELNSQDIFLKYYLANLLYEDNQNNGAVIVYNSILKQNPNDSQIRASKAKTLAKDGNLLSANKEYLTILDKYPNSKQAKYGIFKIYENKLSAPKILEKVNANISNYKVTKQELINFANFLDAMEDYNGARIFKDYIAQIEQEELIKKAQQQKQSPQIQSSQKPKIEPSKKVVQNTPNAPEKKPQVVQKKVTQTQAPVQVEKKPQVVQKKQPPKDTKKYNQYEKAIEDYLKITPMTASVYSAIANTYKLMQEPQNALKYYFQALKLEPANSDINYSIGLTYMELNDFENSKLYLTKAINLDSENAKASKLLSFVNQKLITNIINRAYSKFEDKDYVASFEILDNGIKKFPTNAQLYYYRALTSDAMNRNAAQIIDLQKAIELDPSYYMAYYQLGSAYEKIHDERSALVAYERFLSIEPDEKDLIEQIQKKVLALGAKYY